MKTKTMDDWMVVNDVKLSALKVLHSSHNCFSIELSNKLNGSKKHVELELNELAKLHKRLKYLNSNLPELPTSADPNITWFGFNFSSKFSNSKLSCQLESYLSEALRTIDTGLFEAILFSHDLNINTISSDAISELDYCQVTLKNIENHLKSTSESHKFIDSEQSLLKRYNKQDALIEKWKKIEKHRLALLSTPLSTAASGIINNINTLQSLFINTQPINQTSSLLKKKSFVSSHFASIIPMTTTTMVAMTAEQLEEELVKLQLKQQLASKHYNCMQLSKLQVQHCNRLMSLSKDCLTTMDKDRSGKQTLEPALALRYHNLEATLSDTSHHKLHSLFSLLRNKLYLSLLTEERLLVPLSTSKTKELLAIEQKVLKTKLKLNGFLLSDKNKKKCSLRKLIQQKKQTMKGKKGIINSFGRNKMAIRNKIMSEAERINIKERIDEKYYVAQDGKELSLAKMEYDDEEEGDDDSGNVKDDISQSEIMISEDDGEDDEEYICDDGPFVMIEDNAGGRGGRGYCSCKDEDEEGEDNGYIHVDDDEDGGDNEEEGDDDDGGDYVDNEDGGDKLMIVGVDKMKVEVERLEEEVCRLACQSARVRVLLREGRLSRWLMKLVEEVAYLNPSSVKLDAMDTNIPPPPPLPPLPPITPTTQATNQPWSKACYKGCLEKSTISSSKLKEHSLASSPIFRVTVTDLASIRSKLKPPTHQSLPLPQIPSRRHGYEAVLQEALLKIRDVLKEKDDDEDDDEDECFSDFE